MVGGSQGAEVGKACSTSGVWGCPVLSTARGLEESPPICSAPSTLPVGAWGRPEEGKECGKERDGLEWSEW